MLNALRRIYFYIIASGALLFITLVGLQGALAILLRQAGVISGLGMPSVQERSNAFTLFLVSLVIVLPVGAWHWRLISRDVKSHPDAWGGVVRVVFLDGLTLFASLSLLAALSQLVRTLGSSDQLARDVAQPLASALALCVMVALLLTERRRAATLQSAAAIIARLAAYFGQLYILVWLMLQSIDLSRSFFKLFVSASYPVCAADSAPTAPCVDITYSTVPALWAVALETALLLGALAIYMRWRRLDVVGVLPDVATGLFLLSAGVTAAFGLQNGVEFALNLAGGVPDVAYPASLAGLSGFAFTHRFFPFVGPLIAGVGAATYYLYHAFQTRDPSPRQQERSQAALIGLFLPTLVFLMVGLTNTLYALMQAMRGADLATPEFYRELSYIAPGLLSVPLWLIFARLSAPTRPGPLLPRRMLTFGVMGGAVLGATIALALTLYQVIAPLTGGNPDPSGDTTRRALAATLALGALTAYSVWVNLRDQARMPARQPTTAPELPMPQTVQEALRLVANGQLTREIAKTLLQQAAPTGVAARTSAPQE